MARPYPTTYFTPNRSRIWRTGNCSFSAFFVFDEESVPPYTFMRAARETYPLEVAYGIIFTKENGRNVAKVALSSEKFVDHAVTEGIKVGKSTLLGTRPLRPQAKVIRVSVSDIPMLTPNMKQVILLTRSRLSSGNLTPMAITTPFFQTKKAISFQFSRDSR
jgi:hypothetical protein